MSLKIEQMYAFVSVDDDGSEGVVGMYTQSGWLPLVGADMDRVESLKPIVQQIADNMKKSIKLLYFENRKEIVDFLPGGNGSGRL